MKGANQVKVWSTLGIAIVVRVRVTSPSYSKEANLDHTIR